MNNKIKNIIQLSLFSLLIGVLTLLLFFSPPKKYSESERRELASFPEVSFSSITSGKFMKEFESFTLDQFPFRDTFRSLKAHFSSKALLQKDNNGLYIVDGAAVKIEYPINEKSIDYATDKIKYIYESYLKGVSGKVYISVIPDKNAFYAKENDRLSMDYDAFYSLVKENAPFAEYIDIAPLLSKDDYYLTDTHWKQEKITDVAQKILDSMGNKTKATYTEIALDHEFYGVYYGQAGVPLKSDTLCYLENETISSLEVFDMENSKDIGVYDMEKALGKDGYEMYLSGPLSLVTIENKKANNGKSLVLFRDSFGSSIAPLLAEGYEKITLVDIRYIPSSQIYKYVDFAGADVLFLYSTSVLNSSNTMK